MGANRLMNEGLIKQNPPEDRVGGMHEDCRRFAGRFLCNGETGRRRLENGFRF
jgi:hypothetical protein